jgi:hypothetical protein
MEAIKPKLSNLQIELLKLYANEVSESSWLEIKQLLAKYFADKASDAMDQFCVDNDISAQDMRDWANGHDRAQPLR